jgi:hypothetical protein
MKTLKAIAGILGLCFWFSSGLVWMYFDAHRPTFADPQSGRIYPLNTHGSIVYLTPVENNTLTALTVAGFGLILVATVLHLFISASARK